MAELYGQLAGVSAILAGFSITFLALLLGHQERSRCLTASVAVTIAAAASLLVSALGWTLMGSFLTQTAAQQRATASQLSELDWIGDGHQLLSVAFVIGLLSLVSMLGLSGWLRSRALGVFSTVCAVVAALGVWSILRHMMG